MQVHSERRGGHAFDHSPAALESPDDDPQKSLCPSLVPKGVCHCESAPTSLSASDTASYRLLDSPIHQVLIKDIARQQTLWDVIQKLDGKQQDLTDLIENLGENAGDCSSRREIRAWEPSTPAQFLRLKEITDLVGVRVSALYRYMALGAVPKPKKFGRSSFWVAAEVSAWIAKRIAGLPLNIAEASHADHGGYSLGAFKPLGRVRG
jgi:predicted DNA-binding transcriptional regulator AlpA